MNQLTRISLLVGLLLLSVSESGCYFFKTRTVGDASSGTGVVGESLGPRAGGPIEASLAQIHNTLTPYLPAGVRPDPDLLVRQLLLQYRQEGALVAREIGRVENYRILLGGANVDFTITARDDYDATSLLAKLKVASEICRGLVAPTSELHPGWDSILPYTPAQTEANILFLIQRLTGMPSQRVDPGTIESLHQILDTAQVDGQFSHISYVPVCAALVIDAGALLL